MAGQREDEQHLDDLIERRRMEGSSSKSDVMQKVPELVVNKRMSQGQKGDATLAYTCGAPCLARDCPGGFCPLSRGILSTSLPYSVSPLGRPDLTLRASLAWAFVARFPRSRGVGLLV